MDELEHTLKSLNININNFRRSLEFTLKWEGGYVNDKSDPGGETKWGISKRSYTELEISKITPIMAATIYAKDYWIPSDSDRFDFPYCVAVFDTAVNLGVRRVKRFIGDEAMINHSVVSEIADRILSRRVAHYLNLIKKNPAFKKYERGWMNRVNDLKKLIEINQGSL